MTTDCGTSENETAPTCSSFGTFSRKSRAACWAAARRVGDTSSARIDPDWSVTSMTDAFSTGTATVVCGLASATSSAASAARSSAAGRWRRQRDTPPEAMTPASTGTAVKRTTYLRRRRWASA